MNRFLHRVNELSVTYLLFHNCPFFRNFLMGGGKFIISIKNLLRHYFVFIILGALSLVLFLFFTQAGISSGLEGDGGGLYSYDIYYSLFTSKRFDVANPFAYGVLNGVNLPTIKVFHAFGTGLSYVLFNLTNKISIISISNTMTGIALLLWFFLSYLIVTTVMHFVKPKKNLRFKAIGAVAMAIAINTYALRSMLAGSPDREFLVIAYLLYALISFRWLFLSDKSISLKIMGLAILCSFGLFVNHAQILPIIVIHGFVVLLLGSLLKRGSRIKNVVGASFLFILLPVLVFSAFSVFTPTQISVPRNDLQYLNDRQILGQSVFQSVSLFNNEGIPPSNYADYNLLLSLNVIAIAILFLIGVLNIRHIDDKANKIRYKAILLLAFSLFVIDVILSTKAANNFIQLNLMQIIGSKIVSLYPIRVGLTQRFQSILLAKRSLLLRSL